MQSRSDKERILKRNVENNTERAVRQWEKNHGESAPESVKSDYRRIFEDSARRIDKNINNHFNGDE
jgi:hypothetical protein